MPRSVATWIDPRSHPRAAASLGGTRTTTDPGALLELHGLCRAGRIYEVEDWIRADGPLQLLPQAGAIKGRRPASALEIALQCGTWALVLLLLCNGFDPNLEPSSPLDLALRARRWDLVDLLLEWGADPHRVSRSDLFETYRSELFEHFRVLGVDLTRGHELASTLAYHPSNKPLFGFVRRHREQHPGLLRELDMALGHHVGEGNEKGVLLCLWAGADPHAPAPSLWFPALNEEGGGDADPGERFVGLTAIEEACRRGDARILERLRPDPARDDFDELFSSAANGTVVHMLSRHALPKDVGAVVRSQLLWMDLSRFGTPRWSDTLEAMFKAGARWMESTPDQITDVRRALLRIRDSTFVDVIKLLAKDTHCAPEILLALARTPAMHARLKEAGFSHAPLVGDRFDRPRPTRAREVLIKLGIAPPKIKHRLPPTVTVGRWHPRAREVRTDREKLFEQVWAEPVEQLAAGWGLSDRGLAKACQRLRVPVPPRGFWARARSGARVRRPQLPALPPGEAEAIVIYVAGDLVDHQDLSTPETGTGASPALVQD